MSCKGCAYSTVVELHVNSEANVEEDSYRNLRECIFSTCCPEKAQTYAVLDQNLGKRTSCE